MQDNDQHSDKGFWKFAGYFILSVLVLILLALILMNTVAEPKLRHKIESALGKSPHLTAKVENLEISLFERQVRLENIALFRKDTLQSPLSKTLFIDSLSVPAVTASGIQILPFLFNDNLKIHSISISNPFLKGVRNPDASNNKKKKVQQTLYQRINSFADALEIDNFSIESFSSVITDSSKNQVASLENFSLKFSDIRVDSSQPKRKMLPVSSFFSGSADSVRWETPSGMYRLSTKNFFFSSQDNLLKMKGFRVDPLYPKYKFSQIVGHETDRIDLNIETLETIQLNFPVLVEEQKLFASHINLINSDLEIFHNKKLPFGKKEKRPFPHLLFRQLKTPVKINTISITNADITYREHKKGVPQPGTVTFENTSAVIKNVDNTDQNGITMNATTEVMGVGLMKVNFSFPHNPSGTHYINGYVGPMKMTKFNPALKYLALVQITSGRIDSINFEMELEPLKSGGSLRMDYSNLHIKMIDFGMTGNKNEDPIKTFLSNLFVIDEKDKPPLRVADITYERVTYKSIFNYWWKSLLSGLKNSIGA